MRVVIERPPLNERGEICSKRLELNSRDGPRKVVGMRADVADRATSAVLFGIGTPTCLDVALCLDRSRHPLKRIFDLDGPDLSELTGGDHVPCFMHHRITRIRVGRAHNLSVSRTSFSSAMASSRVAVSGFSQMTSKPASKNALLMGKCVKFGVQMATASILSSRVNSPLIIAL